MTLFRKLGLIGGCLALAISMAPGQDIEVIDIDVLSECQSYAWYAHERIPVYDPSHTADRAESRAFLEEVQRQIREGADEGLGKRGWRRAEQSLAECLIHYSLIQELDLSVVPSQPRQIAPPTTEQIGGLTPASAGLSLERRGTLSLSVLPRGSGTWIWRGTLTASLGKPDSVAKNARKLARKIAGKVPRRR